MTPAETIHHLRGTHVRVEYPVGHCRKDRQNWPCDTIRAIDALEAERERLRGPVATLNDWLERLPDRHVPLRIRESMLRLRNLTDPAKARHEPPTDANSARHG